MNVYVIKAEHRRNFSFEVYIAVGEDQEKALAELEADYPELFDEGEILRRDTYLEIIHADTDRPWSYFVASSEG